MAARHVTVVFIVISLQVAFCVSDAGLCRVALGCGLYIVVFAVIMMLAFSCNGALCMSKLMLYPASRSWPTDRRLCLRSFDTCAFLACQFSVDRYSFAVLQERVVILFGVRTVSCVFLFVDVARGIVHYRVADAYDI
jgi:hypothetical protein